MMTKFPFKRRIIPLGLALAICLAGSVPYGRPVYSGVIPVHSSRSIYTDTSAGDDRALPILVTADTSQYEDGEVFVMYKDGSFEVLKYDDDKSLGAALSELSEDTAVKLIQPDYSYTETAAFTSDAYVSEQWALYNDGTFYMREEQNDFPVYDNPFGTPAGPGQWTRPRLSLPGFGNGGKITIVIKFDEIPSRDFTSTLFGPAEGTVPETLFGPAEGTAPETLFGSADGTAVSPLYGPGDSMTGDTVAVAGIDIDILGARAAYNGGVRDVVVALIDSGIDYNHEDLGGVIWTNPGEIAGNGVDDDGNGYIDDIHGWNFYDGSNRVYVGSEDSHGTHGAGTIAANSDNGIGISGIVDSAHVRIMALKALGGSYGAGKTSSVIAAIRYAEANGAKICNLSFGSSVSDQAVYQAIADSGMLFVVAAGNDGVSIDSTPCYPASYDLDNIMAVANLNYDGTLHYSSNYGSVSVDLAAPGTYILSSTADNSYSYMTGTSMSAPMITGAAALLYTHFGDASLSEIKQILLLSARKLESLSGYTLTGGMLDLGAAVNFDIGSIR